MGRQTNGPLTGEFTISREPRARPPIRKTQDWPPAGRPPSSPRRRLWRSSAGACRNGAL